MTRFFILTICLFISASTQTAAQSLDTSVTSKIDRAVRQEMNNQDIFGLAIGVIKNGKVVYTKGYGYADLKDGTPVTTNTMFRWASVSKPLTATLALKLAEEGTLNLKSDIRNYVPEFPDKGHPITILQLLAHQGCIVHYSNGPVIDTPKTYENPHPYESVINALDKFKASPLVCIPGSEYAYTTHGYILLSAALERAAGKEFWPLMQDKLARPLGLTSLQPDYEWIDIKGRTKGYRKVNDQLALSEEGDVSWKLAGGGFISNIDDMAKFAAALMTYELLDMRTTLYMWTPQKTSSGELTKMSLGFTSTKQHGKIKISHSGKQAKASTRMVLYPEKKDGIVIMTNSEHAKPGKVSTVIFKAMR